jgi:hypothetical protein
LINSNVFHAPESSTPVPGRTWQLFPISTPTKNIDQIVN